MTATLLSTLPGDIPGLLRRGSPALAHGEPVTLHARDEKWRWLGALPFDGIVIGVIRDESDLALDLTDPTGRAHAAWWTFQQRDPPEGWTGFPPPISVEESMVRHCAIMGADMSPEQIDALARLVLRLAGRTP